jgi:hypothetical protein
MICEYDKKIFLKEKNIQSLKEDQQKKERSSDNSIKESDEEEANFVRRLQRGTKKYKGKLPFKCLTVVK